MSLIAEIQRDAVDQSVPVTVLLRKCLVLSARLDHAPLREWVQQELNGYADGSALPAYRARRPARVHGTFVNEVAQWPTAGIPRGAVPEEHRAALFSVSFPRSVAEYEEMASSDEKSFQSPWAQDAVAQFGNEIYADFACVSAWREVPRQWLVGILDQIRNKVLAFALEIEAAAPDAKEDAVRAADIPSERVTQIFNTTILGDVAAFSAGGDAAQVVQQLVVPHDFESLARALRRAGLDEAEVAALAEALAQDGDTLGDDTRRWLGGISGKLATGSLRMAEGVSVALISTLIAKYVGLA